MPGSQWDELVDHLAHTTALDPAAARRVVEEVVAFCGEPAEAFVRRRHRELQSEGLANRQIFELVARELDARPVAAPQLTERQIRRIVYG